MRRLHAEPRRSFRARNTAQTRFITHLAWLHGQGRLRCPRPDIAAGQFVGLVQEFCVWPRVMGLTHSLAVAPPVDTVIDEAIATFMVRYGIGDEADAGESGAREP